MGRVDEAGAGNAISFVNFTKPGEDWKDKNEHIVRSHAMKHVRRRQRARQVAKKHVEELEQTSDERYSSCSASSRTVQKGHAESDASWARQDDEDEEEEDSRETGLAAAQEACQRWEEHGEKYLLFQPECYSAPSTTRRLLAHVAALSGFLLPSRSEKFVLWTNGVRIFMGIAFSSDFLMEAVLAWSATHLSKMTGDAGVLNVAYHHRSRALEGLQRAIKDFSPQNADAILAASIVMSWQAPDAYSWATFMRGKLSVTTAITSGKFESALIDDNDRMAAGDTACQAATPDVDIHGVQIASTNSMLKYGAESLQELRHFVRGKPGLENLVQEMLDFVDDYRRVLLSQSIKRIQQLQRLREMLFWITNKIITQLNADPANMLVVAYLHALPLCVGPVNDVHRAYFQGLNGPPIEAFYEEITLRSTILESKEQEKYKKALPLLSFPMAAKANFKAKLKEMLRKQPSPLIRSTTIVTDYDPAYTNKSSVLRVLESYPVGLWYNFVGEG